MTQPLVGCVIVNWNGSQDTIRCLSALRLVSYPRLLVVIVDNGSTDNSMELIQAAYPDICLIATGRNLGFAGGNNVGIREVIRRGVDYAWLLNNDTQPSPRSLRELVGVAERDFKLGAVGSLLRYASNPEKVQAWGGGWINLWTGYCSHATSHTKRLDFLTAASVLVRRAALEDVGLLDDRFFLYWEDAELCFRLRNHGWNLGVASNAVVLHNANASASRSPMAIERYYTCSAIRFLTQYAHIPIVGAFLFLLFRFCRRALTGRLRAIHNVWQGIEDYRKRDRCAALPFA